MGVVNLTLTEGSVASAGTQDRVGKMTRKHEYRARKERDTCAH